MGFLDKLKKQATKAVDDHGDQIAQGIDKAAAAVDKKTGRKHHGQVETGREKLKDALDSLDGKNDDIR